MNAPAPRPDWDLTAFFSELGAGDFIAFRDRVGQDLAGLLARTTQLGAIEAETIEAWTTYLLELEQAWAHLYHLDSYLHCVCSAEADNEAAQSELAAVAGLEATADKIATEIQRALGAAADDTIETLFADERLQGTTYYLGRMREKAGHIMSAELEGIAADLSIDGLSAWGRLYGKVSGKLTFELAVPGRDTEVLPVAMARSIAEDPSQAVRDAARRGTAVAWESVADTMATCLNAIAGTRLTLYERRGVDHFLDPALFDAGIERATLDAMWAVVRARQDVPRRYLRRKATLLGKKQLGFHDLMAPLPTDEGGRVPWEQGAARVRDAFDATYPALGSFAKHALDKRWVDYSARPAKRPGGFCTSSPVIKESRIFMTYNGAMGDVQTLAHELGHAFHNWLMKDMRFWERRYPMTLAETASTFAENVVTDAALADESLPAHERAAILDTRLQDSEAFLLNIPTRFDFEHELYTRRAAGELTVTEITEIMLEAQRTNYGDALDPEALGPWFWASKLHFYITQVSFYNFPYTFGYLFSLGIFARAKAEGPSFLPRYESLLRRTGSATAEEVARESLGVDLQQPDFWNESIDLIEKDLQAFEAVTAN